jgi:hypothetical protein
VTLCSSARTGRARSVVTARSPRAGHHGGALASVSVTANRRQRAVGELVGATGWTPGTEEGARVHQKGGLTARRCKRRRAVVFNGGGVAPVVVDECGEVLHVEGDKGLRRGAVD